MMGNLAINVTTDGFLINLSATASKISAGPESRHSILFQPIRKDKRELSRDITFESLYRLRNGLIWSKADQEANVINSNLMFKHVILFAYTDLLKSAIYEIVFLIAMEHLTQIVRPKDQVVMELICRLKVRGLKGAGHDELPQEVILPR